MAQEAGDDRAAAPNGYAELLSLHPLTALLCHNDPSEIILGAHTGYGREAQNALQRSVF